jgi:hypothetical protein
MTRSTVLHGITALVGVLDVFEGKFLFRFSDLLSTDQASTRLLVEPAENAFPATLT